MKWKAIGLGLLANLAIDLFAAYLIAGAFDTPEENRALVSFLMVAGLWAVQIYLGVKAAGIALTLPTKYTAKSIASQLSGEGFPPAKPHDDAQRYLAHVADQHEDDAIRMRARFYQGEIAGFNAAGGFARGYSLAKTWDEAILLIA